MRIHALARLRALRSDSIDPPMAEHGCRVVTTTGDDLLGNGIDIAARIEPLAADEGGAAVRLLKRMDYAAPVGCGLPRCRYTSPVNARTSQSVTVPDTASPTSGCHPCGA